MKFRLTVIVLFILILYGVASIDARIASMAGSPETHHLVFDAQPGPDVPTLQELSAGLSDDDAILERVAAYYDENKERLALLWREDHPLRLAGLFSMYITHISLPYGETTFPGSIVEFTQQERAHCGTYLVPQTRIAGALGLTHRVIEFVGEHAWLEVYVDDHWELFDATTNTWINQTGLDLREQVAREYRYFYTPMLDRDRPDARLHIDEGYNMPALRRLMPLMGIDYHPGGELRISTPRGPLADQIPADA